MVAVQPFTSDMIHFMEVPVPKGTPLHPDVESEKPDHMLWPCAVFPDFFTYSASWKTYNIFGETLEEVTPIVKQVTMEVLALTAAGMAPDNHEPVAVLIGPNCTCFKKKDAKRLFKNPQDLLPFETNLWKFTSLCGKVEGVQETVPFLMRLYQNTPKKEDPMEIEETAPSTDVPETTEAKTTQEDDTSTGSVSENQQSQGAAVTPGMSTVGEQNAVPTATIAASRSEDPETTTGTATPPRMDEQSNKTDSHADDQPLLTQDDDVEASLAQQQMSDTEDIYVPLTQDESAYPGMEDDDDEDVKSNAELSISLSEPESPATEGALVAISKGGIEASRGIPSSRKTTEDATSLNISNDGSGKKNSKRKTSLESHSVLEGTGLQEQDTQIMDSKEEVLMMNDQNEQDSQAEDADAPVSSHETKLWQPDLPPEHKQFSDVKKAFQRGGYNFDAGRYCLPRKDPRKNKDAVEGKDYFTSENHFRKYLCEHGVEGAFGKTDKEAIHEWVRMNIVKSVDLSRKLPVFKRIANHNEAIGMLKKLGFQEHKVQGVVVHCVPDATPADGMHGKTLFHSDLELRKHLARFGLPNNCKWGNVKGIVAEEKLRLEYYISTQMMAEDETFEVFSEASNTAGGRTKRRRSAASGADSVSSRSARTPNTSKKAKVDSGKKAKVASPQKKAKNASTNENSSRFGVWSIPKFSTVKEILEKDGYSFSRGKFCRPGYSEVNEKLGENYFETEADFQKDLCMYGVSNCAEWTQEEKDIIHRWIRLSIVSSKKTRGNEIEYTKLGQGEIFDLLKRLGFEQKRIPVLQTEVWCFPGVDPTSGTCNDGVNYFPIDGELRLYLSRSGFPKNCAFDEITSEDLLNLEMMMAGQNQDYTFKIYDRENTGVQRKRNRNYGVERDSGHNKTPKQGRAGKTPKRKKSKGRKSPLASARKDGVDVEIPKNAANEPEEQTADSKHAASDGNTDVASKVSETGHSEKVADGAAEQTVDVPGQVEEARSEAANENLNDKSKDDITRLNLALDNLSTTIHSDASFFACAENKESSFGKKLNEIQAFLRNSITTSDVGNSCYYVCGVPGIGKTSGVLWSVEKVIKDLAAEKCVIAGPGDDSEDMDDVAKPVLCHVNATHFTAVNKTFEAILKQIGQVVGVKGKVDNILKRGKIHAIVVMDEIENLLAKNPKKSFPASESEESLEKLIEMANDDDVHLTLIGISNSVGDEKFARIDGLKAFRTVTFGAYSEDDLKNILVKRLGKSIVAEAAINYISKQASTQHGDARKAISMASDAIKLRLCQLQPGTFSEGPLVSMKEVMIQMKQEKNKFTEIVKGLSEESKAVLAILTALTRVGITQTRMSRLHHYVNNMLESYNFGVKPMAGMDFKALMETLGDQGLLKVGTGQGSMADLTSIPIELGAAAEDIQKAADSELRKESDRYALLLDLREDDLEYFVEEPV